MNTNNTINLIDYLSLTLVLSFFIIHKIFIVLIGLLLSLYSINKNSVLILKKSKRSEKSKGKEISIVNSIQDFPEEKELIHEKSELSLVESIEELGFIPSRNKEKDDRAA